MAKLEPDDSWTDEAKAVWVRACDYYGGAGLWNKLYRVRVFTEELSGFVPWLKGNGRTFRVPRAIDVFPRVGRAQFVDYPAPGQFGTFDNGDVRIERSDGVSVEHHPNHRASFAGSAKLRRWSAADALYFFGYAMTHYLALPFTLAEARLIGCRSVRRRGRALDAISVELPSHLHSHCRKQCFYFDDAGQLLRHDYRADIVGFWAVGAHFWRRQTRVKGLPIALERHVVATFGVAPLPVTALHATFSAAEVELDGSMVAQAEPSAARSGSRPNRTEHPKVRTR